MTATLAITTAVKAYPGETTPSLNWTITDGNIDIAELWIDPDTHIIGNVWVHETHRGEGHATRLYQQASDDLAGDIRHDVPWHRTPEGDRWAEQVGGESADTCDCCNHLFDLD